MTDLGAMVFDLGCGMMKLQAMEAGAWEETPACPSCETEPEPGWKFCPCCGERFSTEAELREMREADWADDRRKEDKLREDRNDG